MNDWIPYEDLSFEFLKAHQDLSSFSCTDPDLNEFLKQDALPGQNERVSATRLVKYEDSIAGFFTLVNDSITVNAVQQADGVPLYSHNKYPAIKIARSATHQDLEDRGIGINMLLKIYGVVYNLSKHSGCRMITVDSKENQRAVNFYAHKGFQRASICTPQ